MSEGINTVTLVGNLGADAELRQTASGPVCRLRLATTASFLDKEKNRKEETEWHRVTIFGRRGEALAPRLKKGDRLAIQGRLHTSSYDKEGQKHYSTEIIALDVALGGRSNRRASEASEELNRRASEASEVLNGGFVRPPAPEASLAPSDLPF